MKNHLFFTLLASLILLPFVFLGQTHVLHLPQKYLFPTSTVEAPKPEDAISNRPWFVWSDRANNPVYRTSNCSELIAELEFGVECAVLEINNERLLIAHAKEIRQGNLLDPEAKPIGWIDFNNLLLHFGCLKAGPCKLDKKALVFNADDRDGLTQTDIPPKFLNGPDHIYEVITDAGMDLVRKYFVFKETSDYLLLGNTPFLEKINIFDDAIVGWMPKKYCLIWNSNVALEINWEPEAVKEREEMHYPVMVWKELSDAESHNLNAKPLFQELQPYQKRTTGFMNRFFILDQNGGQKEFNYQPIKVGMIINIDDEIDDNDKIDGRAWLSMPKQTYREGFTFFQPKEANHQWFRYVLLIERNELFALQYALRDLVIAKNYPINYQRVRLFEALEQTLQVFHRNSNRKMFNEQTFDELFFCTTGQLIKSKFSKMKIVDFMDIQKVSNSEIIEVINYFERTLEKIDQILSINMQKYPTIMTLGSQSVYYWVPMDIFVFD